MDAMRPFIEDREAVLARLGGSETMLARLLDKFCRSYSRAPEELETLLESGQHEEARRLVHSVKGVSANLGLASIYRSSIALENKLKDESERPSPEIHSFKTEIQRIIDGFSRTIDDAPSRQDQ